MNDTGVKIPEDHGVSLLFDGIIDGPETNRTEALQDKVDDSLGNPKEGYVRNYQAQYLDLVDVNNGNAWVKASDAVTVYWGYPEGTDQSTNFKLYHFEGLHRDGENSGFNIDDLNNPKVTVEGVSIDKGANGISFNVEPGGFSPFVLTWDTDARHTITATAGAGGTISPSGEVKVADGGSATFTVKANPGYEIASVKVDDQEAALSDNGTYTFTNVTAGHTISASFRSTGGTATTYHTITASAGEGGSISPSGRVTVANHGSRSFSIAADEGWTVQNVIVDGVNVGPRGSYTFSDVTEDHTISVTFTEGNAPADPDESGVSEWFDTDNHYAYLHGYGDGTLFGPENPMTRAEAAQMFYNLLRDKSGGDRPVTFEDVPEDAFYAEPVRVLASLGMINGTSPTTYEPDRPITRAEFVAIAMRFSNGEVTGENIFSDVPEDAWYRDYVVGAVGYGWILGFQGEDATFGPEQQITRSQATTVANRMLGRVADGAWIEGHMGELKLFEDVPRGHFAFRDIVEATNAHEYERDGRYEEWTGLTE
ncbi:S-layer homology domain-containing protein [Thermophilibacter mediterraneus]|uniref:S-layer homology domain-containing protein n=1 Tax=Thermophilibacter mediterraneus TaxID=1871031 RepID=UPI002353E01A|nr:S-layer homology domain-containing protein [Thermophilibacter mediterraneus]